MGHKSLVADVSHNGLLIKLGIVVIAAVTLSACGNDGMSPIESRYQEAGQFVDDAMRSDQLRVSEGYASSLPGDTASWVALLNTSGTLSPSGGPGYRAGTLSAADEASGIIGLVASNRGRTVTLTRPAHGDLSGQATQTFEYGL